MKSKVLVLGLLALSFDAFSSEFSLKTRQSGNYTTIDIERSEACKSHLNVQLINHDRFKLMGAIIVRDVGVDEPVLDIDLEITKLKKHEKPQNIPLKNSFLVAELFREPMLVESESYEGLSVKVIGCGHQEELKVELGTIVIKDVK